MRCVLLKLIYYNLKLSNILSFYLQLTKLDQSMLSGLGALQILNIRNNLLRTVAANSFLFQHNLHILLLSHNDLETLHSRAIAGLPVLNSLSLDNNRLTGLHRNALRNCSSLQVSPFYIKYLG